MSQSIMGGLYTFRLIRVEHRHTVAVANSVAAGEDHLSSSRNKGRFMSTATAAEISAKGRGMTKDEKFVIFASSTGTVFEWYDFYLYATLAPFFASLFFPPGNDTAALLSAFATYAAGFLVRPFGALIFGRVG